VITPEIKPDDLFFGHIHHGNNHDVTPEALYGSLQSEFSEMVDFVYPDKGCNASNGRARNISLKIFRDFVKSTLSDAGHSDYGEWYIGHSGSTYYQKSDRERAELFRKVESCITYLDVEAMEARGATVEAKLERSEARFLQYQKEAQRQWQENALLAACVLSKSESEKQEATARLREFYAIQSTEGRPYATSNLEVLDRFGGVNIQSRPKFIRGSRDDSIQRVGEFTVPESKERHYFIGIPKEQVQDIEKVEFRDGKKKQK
jgi:hypothetical protein